MGEKIIEEFNLFIKNWCGSSYPHLIDSDENDGERFREKLKTLLTQQERIIEDIIKGINTEFVDFIELGKRGIPLKKSNLIEWLQHIKKS